MWGWGRADSGATASHRHWGESPSSKQKKIVSDSGGSRRCHQSQQAFSLSECSRSEAWCGLRRRVVEGKPRASEGRGSRQERTPGESICRHQRWHLVTRLGFFHSFIQQIFTTFLHVTHAPTHLAGCARRTRPDCSLPISQGCVISKKP